VSFLQSKGLKVFLAISRKDGFTSAEEFSEMAKSQLSRSKFIANVMALLEKYGFDGFAPKWTYPACPMVKEI